MLREEKTLYISKYILKSDCTRTPTVQLHDFLQRFLLSIHGNHRRRGRKKRRIELRDLPRSLVISIELVLRTVVHRFKCVIPSAKSQLIFQRFHCADARCHHPCFSRSAHGWRWLWICSCAYVCFKLKAGISLWPMYLWPYIYKYIYASLTE